MDNISQGTATVTITGIGAYTGTTSTTFEIVEITPPLISIFTDKTFGALLI